MTNYFTSVVNNVLQITEPKTCLIGLVCPDSTLLTLVGVLFTIIASLYIYMLGEKNDELRIAFLKELKVIWAVWLGLFALFFSIIPCAPVVIILSIIIIFMLCWDFFKLQSVHKDKYNTDAFIKEAKQETLKLIIKGREEELEVEREETAMRLNNEIGIYWEDRDKDKKMQKYYPYQNGVLIRFDLRGIIEAHPDIEFKIPYFVDNVVKTNVPILYYDSTKQINLNNFIKIKKGESARERIFAEMRYAYAKLLPLILNGDASTLEFELSNLSDTYITPNIEKTSPPTIIKPFIIGTIFPLQKIASNKKQTECLYKLHYSIFDLATITILSAQKNQVKNTQDDLRDIYAVVVKNLFDTIMWLFDCDEKDTKIYQQKMLGNISNLANAYLKEKPNNDWVYHGDYATMLLGNYKTTLIYLANKVDTKTYTSLVDEFKELFDTEQGSLRSNFTQNICLIHSALFFILATWLYYEQTDTDNEHEEIEKFEYVKKILQIRIAKKIEVLDNVYKEVSRLRENNLVGFPEDTAGKRTGDHFEKYADELYNEIKRSF